MFYFSKKIHRATGWAVSSILVVAALVYSQSRSEVQVTRSKLRSALVQMAPNATNWSRSQRVLHALSKRIPPEQLQDQIDRHRKNLVRLGYFGVVEIQIPTADAYRQFEKRAFTTRWQCDLWSFSGYTGTVRVIAFKGDTPGWRRLGEISAKEAAVKPER